jgi:hypothetical protein
VGHVPEEPEGVHGCGGGGGAGGAAARVWGLGQRTPEVQMRREMAGRRWAGRTPGQEETGREGASVVGRWGQSLCGGTTQQ